MFTVTYIIQKVIYFDKLIEMVGREGVSEDVTLYSCSQCPQCF